MEPGLGPDEMFEEEVMNLAKTLAKKGYVVRLYAPSILYHPSGTEEIEFRIEWTNPHIHPGKSNSAMVAPSGLPQAIKFFTDLPSARVVEMLTPLRR